MMILLQASVCHCDCSSSSSGHSPHTSEFSNMSKYPGENSPRKHSLEVFIASAGSSIFTHGGLSNSNVVIFKSQLVPMI